MEIITPSGLEPRLVCLPGLVAGLPVWLVRIAISLGICSLKG